MTLELSGVIPVKQIVVPHGVVLVPAKEEPMGAKTSDQLWRVEIDGEDTITIPDLTFGDAMRNIQDAFEQSNEKVHYVSIERQG